MRTRILKLLVVGWLVAPLLARAQFTFTTNSGALTVTGYTGPSSLAVIPASTNGLAFVAIGANAFNGNSIITNVYVPASVTNIAAGAFLSCPDLTAVYCLGDAPVSGAAFSSPTVVYYFANTSGWNATLGGVPTAQASDPDFSFTVIGGTATIQRYNGTSGQVNFPSAIYGLTVTDIEGTIFTGANRNVVTNIIVPNTITNIGGQSFSLCTALRNVSLPASLVSLGDEAFRRCTSLTNMTVDVANPVFSSVGGVLFNKAQTKLVQYPAGLFGDYLVPSGVLSLGSAAFEYAGGLTNVNLPATLTNIDQLAFFNCSNLVAVLVPNSVQAFGSQAFDACISLRSINIPDSLTTFLSAQVFSGCSALTNILAGGANPAYSSVGGVLFDKAQQTLVLFPAGLGPTYTIPNGVLSLGDQSFFASSSLTNLFVPASVTSLGTQVFSGSTLTTIYFQGDAPTAANTFLGSSLANVFYFIGTSGWGGMLDTVPISPVVYPPFSFLKVGGTLSITHCAGSLGQVIIPSAIYGVPVASIGGIAFNGATSRAVTNIFLPDTITNLDTQAFFGCTNLSTINLPVNLISLGSEVFRRCLALTNIIVDPANPALSSLGGILFNKSQTKLITYPAGLGGGYTIPNGVLSLEYGAFEYSGVTNVILPATLTNIDQRVFLSCTNLVTIFIPNSVQSLGYQAFNLATSLRSINIPDSLTNLLLFGSLETFDGCFSLTNISVGSANPTYSSVAGVLFDKAQHTLLVFPDGLGGTYTVPNGVTSLADESFGSCIGLTNLFVPGSVTSLGASALSFCPNLMAIYFQGNPPAAANAFSGNTTPTAYYIFGISGWGSTLGGIPAVGVTSPDFEFNVANGSITITSYKGSDGQAVVPSSFLGVPITGIDALAFELAANLKSVTISGSVTNIGANAFQSCPNLTAIYFLGNAPTASTPAFSSPAVVYYLPGRSGWGATLGGVPAVLWNPQATQFAVTSGQFGFHLTGPANVPIVVEACTNLANPSWLPVSTNTLTGGNSQFADPQSANYPGRYYRLRSP